MYKPLPDSLTIGRSPIHGLGLFATCDISLGIDLGIAHVNIVDFPHGYCRTPLGGFYNHSNNPSIMRMVSDALPTLKFGDLIDPNANTQKLKDGKNDRENLFYNLNEKGDAKYMFLISCKDIKAGEELTANYNLYTYPKTGIGIQML